jgi:hypothetical protein
MRTILWKEDWAEFPSAIADTQTRNVSFLKLVALYKKMGIENAEFCLALLQPELQGVDPYDPNLDDATKMKIWLETKYNPWYYFREIARIPPTSGNNPIPFKANRGNISLFWSFFNHIDFGLLQPRQTGKSVSTDVLMTGMMYVWGENTVINLITKDSKLRNANIERLKVMQDLLPDYIHLKDPMDADNQELMTCIRLNNKYKTAVGRNDKIAADKLGRGLTVPIMHFDELAYINLIEYSLPVALASGSAARDEARANGQPYGNVFTTTAGNITTRDGAFAHEFLTGGAPWTEKFFDLSGPKELRKVVEKSSSGKKPIIYGAFNHRQLGRTDEWLFSTLRESAQYGEIADRDYFNIWTVGGEGSPISQEEKKLIKESEREPNFIEITPTGYTIRWFVPREQIADKMANSKFMMGVDPSELLGRDNDSTGMVIFDIETHDIIATGRYNETNVQQLSQFFADLLIKYQNVLFVPERKSLGTAIIDYVVVALHRAGQDPFKRIFNRCVDECTILETEFRDIQTPLSVRQPSFYDRFKRYFGYATNGSGRYSRDSLYMEALPSSMVYGARRIQDNLLITEILSLTIRNGRIDHSRGNHDDLVISMLLGHWVCIRGQNLSYYGIRSNVIFSKATLRDYIPTKVELYHEQKANKVKADFEKLVEEMKVEKNPMISAQIELKLRAMARLVNLEESAGVGIDAMIRQVKDERSRRVRSNRFSPQVTL